MATTWTPNLYRYPSSPVPYGVAKAAKYPTIQPAQVYPQIYKPLSNLPLKAEPTVFPFTSIQQHLPLAGLLYVTGLLLHRLPSLNRPGANWLPTDWKVWARVILGILTTSQINKAFQWKPPAWIAGMETVGIIHPLTSGFSKNSLKQLVVIAPLVGGIVETASRLHKGIATDLHEEFGIPPVVTRLAISTSLVLVGVKLFPLLFKSLQKVGWFAKAGSGKTGSMMVSSMTTCARGCTPGGVICLSEVGELFGGMGNWFHTQQQAIKVQQANAK